jgi:hypothetical protein
MSSWLYMRFDLVPSSSIHKTNRRLSLFLVPLPSALFRTVFQLQLPRICSSQDKGFVPRAPKHHRGTPGTGTDPGGTSKLALVEGQWYRMAFGVKLDRWQIWSIHFQPRVLKVDESHLTTLPYKSLNPTPGDNYTDIITETNDHQPVLPVG